ncbi:DUF397 domain-containing protein [Streptomyces sp. NPDC020681]|uniref:DUF397 domain-containing protein n=1 Tax=Streptomyces sp. NPDC020681 TaxID=3365083 RepID=UPI0037A0DC68
MSVESELRWFKSSYSSSDVNSDCVEVATTPRTVHVRDSKNTTGQQLAIAPHVWADFVAYAANR